MDHFHLCEWLQKQWDFPCICLRVSANLSSWLYSSRLLKNGSQLIDEFLYEFSKFYKNIYTSLFIINSIIKYCSLFLAYSPAENTDHWIAGGEIFVGLYARRLVGQRVKSKSKTRKIK